MSIHYSGRFRKDQSLEEFNSEIEEIARIMKWRTQVLEPGEFPKKNGPVRKNILYGIAINVDGCETVAFTVLSNRKLTPLYHFELLDVDFKGSISTITIEEDGKVSEKPDNTELDFTKKPVISVKTQFASFDVHMQIIKLISYLNEKYFEDFELLDETEYWEKRDEKESRQKFERLLHIIHIFRSDMNKFSVRKGESIENAIIRAVRNTRRKIIQHRDKEEK